MFRNSILTAILTALFAAMPTARADDDQTWKLGVMITGLGGGDRGCVVNHVFDNSPAMEIGLEPGDVLLTVNGQLASDTQGVRNMIFSSDSVTLVLKRGNGYFQKDVTFTNVVPDQSQGLGGNGAATVMASQKKVTKVATYAVQAPKPLGGKSNTVPKPLAPYKPLVHPNPMSKPTIKR